MVMRVVTRVTLMDAWWTRSGLPPGCGEAGACMRQARTSCGALCLVWQRAIHLSTVRSRLVALNESLARQQAQAAAALRIGKHETPPTGRGALD